MTSGVQVCGVIRRNKKQTKIIPSLFFTPLITTNVISNFFFFNFEWEIYNRGGMGVLRSGAGIITSVPINI